MRTLQKLIFLFGILCCTAGVALAEDLPGVYKADEFVPGSSDAERWTFLCSRMPEVLGQSRDHILKSFGSGSRSKWYCGGPKQDYLEYCISQKINDDGSNTCRIVDLFFDNDKVCRVKIDNITAR